MLIAGLGVIAALAFVLGLGALALWALKRFGNGMLSPRSRVPVEVVQRVSLGPKTGLAVVRVGEKVMAMSIGEGGLRPLFELDEADRQRVIATSPMPTPHVSSDEAMSALERAAFFLLKMAKFRPLPLIMRRGQNRGVTSPKCSNAVYSCAQSPTVACTTRPPASSKTPPRRFTQPLQKVTGSSAT